MGSCAGAPKLGWGPQVSGFGVWCAWGLAAVAPAGGGHVPTPRGLGGAPGSPLGATPGQGAGDMSS